MLDRVSFVEEEELTRKVSLRMRASFVLRDALRVNPLRRLRLLEEEVGTETLAGGRTRASRNTKGELLDGSVNVQGIPLSALINLNGFESSTYPTLGYPEIPVTTSTTVVPDGISL